MMVLKYNKQKYSLDDLDTVKRLCDEVRKKCDMQSLKQFKVKKKRENKNEGNK